MEVAEEKLLPGRQPRSQEAEDREAEELQRRELQAWDERFGQDAKKERNRG